MPVTLTAVGTTLNIVIIDENFKNIEELCWSGIITADVVGTFERYKILRYTGGRLVSMETFARPYVVEDRATSDAHLDLTFRPGTLDPGLTADYLTYMTTPEARNHYAMELLGRPGPTHYLQWEEDGLAAPVVAGWPPAWYPANRYPKELSFSKWLTVPYASTKVFVDEPCTAKVTATAKGSLNLSRLLAFYDRGLTYSPVNAVNFNYRSLNMGRFGLVVDTNPNLFSDEFVNSNPNILNPLTGAQATYKSWNVIQDRTFGLPQRAHIKMSAAVALKGRRNYNFSMKFRGAAHDGYIEDNAGVKNWRDGEWEGANYGFTNSPIFAATWRTLLAFRGAAFDVPYYSRMCFWPSFINLWENCSINVEFQYGRDEAYVTDSTNAEFTSKPV